MKILIDMNLPPRWASFLAAHGSSASHWSVEGDMKAPDSEILWWARERNYIVLTHDLDFGVLLSMTQKAGPSVIQVRTQDVTPEAIGSLVRIALEKHREALDQASDGRLHAYESLRSREVAV